MVFLGSEFKPASNRVSKYCLVSRLYQDKYTVKRSFFFFSFFWGGGGYTFCIFSIVLGIFVTF